MITLTTEIKSRCFRECDKQMLYNRLREPFREKMNEVKNNFKDWLDENVMSKVLDPDLSELGNKPYCVRSTSRFIITPKELGLEETYIGLPNLGKLCSSLKFEHQSKKYSCAVDGNTYTINITNAILKKCTPEVIEQVKYFLFENAKADFDFTYYGVGTFVKPDCYSSSHYGVFRDLKTWGNLYTKNPEMFETLYKMLEGKEFKEEKKEIEPERRLLLDLKTSLGY